MQQLRRPGGPGRAQGVDAVPIRGDNFQPGVKQKIFDEPFEPFAGLADFLPHFGNVRRLQRVGGGGEHFGVGDDAVERRAHLVRQHQGNMRAQRGKFLLGVFADGPHFAQARVHGGFTEWDVGFCSLAPGMMTYLGERISFSLQGTSTRPPDGLYRRPFDAGAIRDYR